MTAISRWKQELDLTITIATSTTISSVYKQGGVAMASVQFPTGFEGTSFNVEVSNDGTNWDLVVDDAGNEVGTIAEAGGLATRTVQLPTESLAAAQLRLVAATAQAANRTIKFVGYG